MGKSGKQTNSKASSKEQEKQGQEDSSPYGKFTCERKRILCCGNLILLARPQAARATHGLWCHDLLVWHLCITYVCPSSSSSLCVCVCLRVIADGLVGAFVEDYPVLCERSDLTALEVQVNATRPGRFINLILKDENEPSTLSEIQLARKSVTP